jgi:hypothetical protein
MEACPSCRGYSRERDGDFDNLPSVCEGVEKNATTKKGRNIDVQVCGKGVEATASKFRIDDDDDDNLVCESVEVFVGEFRIEEAEHSVANIHRSPDGVRHAFLQFLFWETDNQ